MICSTIPLLFERSVNSDPGASSAKIAAGNVVFLTQGLNFQSTDTFSLVFPLSIKDLEFERSPSTVISSLGKPVTMHCSLKGSGGEEEDPPDVVWLRDDVPLLYADTNQFQVLTGTNSWTIMTARWLLFGKKTLIQLNSFSGLPHFSVEPQHMSVVANVSLSLSCVAHGPPEPVRVIWLQDGAPLNSLTDPVALSPSTLNLTGLNRTSTFSCEAHNRKGVATSGSGTITGRCPQTLALNSLRLSWQPGFGGDYPIIRCSVQAKHSGESYMTGPDKLIHNQNVNIPPAAHLIGDLEPHSLYAVRVACHSSQGPSDWTPWVELRTKEGVPENPPVNVTAVLNGTEVLMAWEGPPGKLNGELQGYMVEYSTPAAQQVSHDHRYFTDPEGKMLTLQLLPFKTYMTHLCVPTPPGPSSPPAFSWHWWYVVMAIAGAVSIAVLMAVYVAKLRRKETRFGEAFEPMMESGELVVRYRARRTYSRRTTEATLNSLGISDELKQKLQDVMVDRHKLTLGKTLGEGEFGSVMEGLLTQEESVLKVAVKTMKIAICTRSEMEDFLREAACMKEFDHPNVMRLLGVCLQTVESEGYPSPVVILPYMKHGDLHSYLLYSRLGDCPVYLPSQMLVKFMTDIARGMEYLSSKNFIHRDLAARNCMLNENMNVCVADFGLSKKIYNGDYYRQGRISKMPVKWIAIESLADRVYTTKSDVWSFGVTMWEIATRGQTPYPGVENSEIYDYLRQGNRLKQPPDCLDCIYALMFSCWLLSPKDRPSFESLRCELEKALEDLPDTQDPDEILYVNMDESSMELGAVGGRDPTGGPTPLCLKGLDSVTTVEVHPLNRYVLCPQHETNRTLCDSMESLDMPVSSSTATLPLQPSYHSTPSSTPAPTPTVELLEDRDSSRKMPWQ
uniref:receptor protein-tyrosine kinase n=1 Tax=Amphiprion ocellaris TaxID=80972 RepID=A0AAQ5YL74_AMPOC